MRLEGKVAVVTGGGSGIGLASVRRFVAEGARVVALDRNVDRLAEEFGGSDAVVPLAGDVTRSADSDAAVARLDVLVTAAGVAQPSSQRTTEFGGDITDVTDEDFAEVVESTCTAPSTPCGRRPPPCGATAPRAGRS
jgi:NAD(P)-dependent dehydrogenase (short-subunit alcohol dehydrogenase family)